MHHLITSYLIQAKECTLPGIGSFKKSSRPSSLDVANKLLYPPTEEIVFSERTSQPAIGFIEYIALKKNTDNEEAIVLIKNWCRIASEKLNNQEEILFEGFGTLMAGPTGTLFFRPSSPPAMLQPVTAERVIVQNSSHTVLVGDRESTNVEMNEYLNQEEDRERGWKIPALIMLFLAIIFFIFYFLLTKNANSSFGNQNHFITNKPEASFSTP